MNSSAPIPAAESPAPRTPRSTVIAGLIAFAPVPQDSRAVWVVVLLFGNVVAFPVYWYVAWWRKRAR